MSKKTKPNKSKHSEENEMPVAELIATGTEGGDGYGNGVNIAAADGVGGGNVSVKAGNGTTDGGGGALDLNAGDSGTQAAGGPVNIKAGNGGSEYGGGGELNFTSGSAVESGDGGQISFYPGAGAGTGGRGAVVFNLSSGLFILDGLATSDPSFAGALWNDAGALKISAG